MVARNQQIVSQRKGRLNKSCQSDIFYTYCTFVLTNKMTSTKCTQLSTQWRSGLVKVLQKGPHWHARKEASELQLWSENMTHLPYKNQLSINATKQSKTLTLYITHFPGCKPHSGCTVTRADLGEVLMKSLDGRTFEKVSFRCPYLWNFDQDFMSWFFWVSPWGMQTFLWEPFINQAPDYKIKKIFWSRFWCWFGNTVPFFERRSHYFLM